MVTRIVEVDDDLVFADLDFPHLVEYREERHGLYIEPRDGPFDQDLLRLIEHGVAVVGEGWRGERGGGECRMAAGRRLISEPSGGIIRNWQT